MNDRMRRYRRYGGQFLSIALMLMAAACSQEGTSPQPLSGTVPAPVEELSTARAQQPPAEKSEVQRPANEDKERKGTASQSLSPQEDSRDRMAVDTVLQMYEALHAEDREAYFRYADIASVRMTPSKLDVLIEEAGKRELKPERFRAFDKHTLAEDSRRLLSIHYGSQVELVLEELSYGDQNVWFVNVFPDGPKVIDHTAIYPGAYELGREASFEELVSAGIQSAAEYREFLASNYDTPLWTPIQTVSLLYQAAQEGDEQAFAALAGGGEGYYAELYASDMMPFADWMKAYGSVQAFPLELLPRERIAEAFRESCDERYGDAWQFVAAWEPENAGERRGAYWILTLSADQTRYVVREAFTGNLQLIVQ